MDLESMETIADVIILLATGYVALLFWRLYALGKTSTNLLLAIAFGFVSIFKTLQVLTEVMLGLEAFKWMGSILAAEVLIIILVFSVIFVLKGQQGSRQIKPNKNDQDRKHAA